jgi:hypothetical protein
VVVVVVVVVVSFMNISICKYDVSFFLLGWLVALQRPESRSKARIGELS